MAVESGSTRREAPVQHGLRPAFALHTRLFINALDGVTDEQAARRTDPRVNSLAFIGAHLVDVRHYTLGYVGRPATNPLTTALRDVSGIDDDPDLPGLGDLRSYWQDVSVRLESAIDALGSDSLAASSPQSFPIDDGTVLGGLHFLLHHEAYHIGQLALLRKQHGHPAMKYR